MFSKRVNENHIRNSFDRLTLNTTINKTSAGKMEKLLVKSHRNKLFCDVFFDTFVLKILWTLTTTDNLKES